MLEAAGVTELKDNPSEKEKEGIFRKLNSQS